MKTFHRAKSALGVISVKRGGGWYWELPIEVAFTECDSNSQDGQTPGVSTLAVAPLHDETVRQDIHSDALNILSGGCGDVATEDGQTPMSNPLTIFPQAEAG